MREREGQKKAAISRFRLKTTRYLTLFTELKIILKIIVAQI